MPERPTTAPTVAIIGAGMSGLLMGIKLAEAGIDTFTLYEKADRIGGTWRENTYPGLCCDVPARYYTYSFEPNPHWSALFAPGAEIQEYFERVTADYGLARHLRFNQEIDHGRFEDGRWHLWTKAGEEIVADFVVAATGFLHHPHVPELPGLDTFEGPAFHTARWDHDVDLAGKRVGIVGTGSSGVQVVSAIAERVDKLSVFQRTPQWVFPVPNHRHSRLVRTLMRSRRLNRLSWHAYRAGAESVIGEALVRPGWQRHLLNAICNAHLRTVRDPDLRRRLTPDYQPACKRLIISGSFYRAVQRDNVELVDTGIERIEPAGVVSRDGRHHELDVLVLATGFRAHDFMRPIELVGPDGTTLSELWAERAISYRTVALPGFPNLFTVPGPFSPLANASIIEVAESQVAYAMQWIERFRAGRMRSAAPRRAATDAFLDEVEAALPDTVWAAGCRSYYLGTDGRPELWPWNAARHREMLRTVALDDWEVEPRPALDRVGA